MSLEPALTGPPTGERTTTIGATMSIDRPVATDELVDQRSSAPIAYARLSYVGGAFPESTADVSASSSTAPSARFRSSAQDEPRRPDGGPSSWISHGT